MSTENETKQQEKQLTKKELVDEIFNPDECGISNWVSREYLSDTHLKLTNNGNARHGVFFGDNRFFWEKYPQSGMIQKLRTIGLSDNESLSRPIRTDIHHYHKNVIGRCVVCGSRSSLITDHKNDLYNDLRVLNINTQTIDDFQCLCTHCNLQKRQVSKKQKETQRRYNTTNIPQLTTFGIDFISGDETFDPNDPNAMVGTYWYDPVAFFEYVNLYNRNLSH